MVHFSLFVPALLATLATAQQLISTSLPACAQTCSILVQAQTSCQSNPGAAQSCFCQSGLLATVKTAPQTNLCNGFCSQGDWTTIANWYNQQACANGGTSASTLATSTTPAAAAGGSSAPPATSTAAASASSASAAAAAANTEGTNAADYKNGSEWWAGHYQWIIMLIVLLVAFVVLGVVGSILYKRHQRRQNTVSISGRGSEWAPNQGAHDFDTQGRQALAAAPPVTDEKAESGTRRTRTLTRKR